MISRSSAVPLRERAVRALEESTRIFEQAFILLKQGRRKEAEQLRNNARAKRNDSVWLMAKANELDKTSPPAVSSPYAIPSQYYEVYASTAPPQ